MIHPEVIDAIRLEVRKAIADTVGREVVAPLTGRMARLEALGPDLVKAAVAEALEPLAARVEAIEKAAVPESEESDGGKKKHKS